MLKKQLLVITVIGLMTAGPVLAKPKDEPPKTLTLEDIVARMKAQLELTDDQAIEVRPIVENYLQEEKQIKLEEKQQLSRVLTGQQLYTWNFLENEQSRDKKKKKGF